jgi:hypothetical protein
VIRFSAGLVVVAIGVLIGGVATSKLSLVYVAIAVSAFALVALAIGVALKRDELFGGGPELAAASADAGSGTPVGQSADAGHGRGNGGHVREDLEQIRPSVPVASHSAVFAGAAASPAGPVNTPPLLAAQPTAGSSAGRPAVDNPPLGNPPLGPRRSAFGQVPVREADSAADWQTRPSQPPWSSGDQVRPTWTPKEQTVKEQAPTKASPPKEPPSASTGTTSVPARERVSSDQPPARSWFDRLNQPVADTAERTVTDPSKSDPSKSDPSTGEPSKSEPWKSAAAKPSPAEGSETIASPASPADVSPAAAPQTIADESDADTDDDDWPTRYSWLEDDETVEAADARKPEDVAEVEDVAEPEDVSEVTQTLPPEAKAVQPAAAEAPEVAAPDVAMSSDAATEDSAAIEASAAIEDSAATADDADAAADASTEPSETPVVNSTHEDESSAPQQSEVKLVTVIPGVPRYHDPDCILIRFMDEDDVARKSIPEAKAANCTPCIACQPEG